MSDSYASRNVKNLPVTDEMQNDDKQLFEDENFASASFLTLKNRLHSNIIYNKLPVIYTESSKGGTISSRSDVYNIVYSLILASYGAIDSSYTVKLGIWSDDNYFKFGSCIIEELSGVDQVEMTLENGTKEYYEDLDSTSLNGFIVSPLGEIIGTETW